MNAKKFEKKLNQFAKNELVYPLFIEWAFSHDKKSFFHDKSLISLFQEHYCEIISKCLPSYRFLLISKLSEQDGMGDFTREQLPFLLSFVDSEYDLFSFDSSCPDLNIIDYINMHFTSLISIVPNTCLYSMAIGDYNIDNKNINSLDQFLIKNKREYVEFLLGNKLSKESRNYDDVIDIAVKLVDEILEHENLSYVDISKNSDGGFSDVIFIGSKVLKVGKKRDTYVLPNNDYLLKPYIRVNLEDISDVFGTIEVVEKVDTIFHYPSHIDEYDFYKKLRSKGVVWLDIKLNNLGILEKDNVFHWNKPLGEDMSVRGLISDDNLSSLTKGNPIILDSDHLYSEEMFYSMLKDEEFHYAHMPGYDYEQKYQKELADILNDKTDDVVDGKKIR